MNLSLDPRRRPLVLSVVVIVLGALAYIGASLWLGDRVPRGTTVAGVAVGGQDAATATSTLTTTLVPRAAEPITLKAADRTATLVPADAGVALDLDGTVDELVGFSLNPVNLWRHLSGGSEVAPDVTVDAAAFATAIDATREALDTPATEGSLTLPKGKVVYKAPVTGTTVQAEATAKAVAQSWPAVSTVDAVVSPAAPKVSAEEFDRVRTEFAEVAVSGPVKVVAGKKTFELAPAAFAPALTLTADASGRITPAADPKKLVAIVREAARKAEAEVEGTDAVVTYAGGTYHVAPAVTGIALDEASIRSEVFTAIGSTQRTATVKVAAKEPKFSTAKAKATLPKGLISSFTTNYPCCLPRVSNIKKASGVVNGTYVPPGGQFSLNAVLGQRTAASGYVKAGVIMNGRSAIDYGGGISQVSTTIFNAAFFSGMQLDAWTPHTFYISRYPEGREATISWPDVHHKWTNTTDGGVRIQVTATDTSITVSFYGTKKWDIEATKSNRFNIRSPRTIVDDSPTCVPQSPVQGFTVTVGRIFRQNGAEVKRQSFTTTYQPEDFVTCTNPQPQ